MRQSVLDEQTSEVSTTGTDGIVHRMTVVSRIHEEREISFRPAFPGIRDGHSVVTKADWKRE